MKTGLRILLLVPILFFLIITGLQAQRSVSYQDLVERSDRPNLYTERTLLPAADGKTLMMFSFRMDYDLLPFRQESADPSIPPADRRYFSVTRVNLELQADNQPTFRETWRDTAWAVSHEQTRSRSEHLEGAVSTELTPGSYRMRAEIGHSDRPEQRSLLADGRNRRDQTREQRIEIPDFEEREEGSMFILENAEKDGSDLHFRLLNYGSAVLYGEDLKLLTLLPTGEPAENYRLEVYLGRGDSDPQPDAEPVHTEELSQDRILRTAGFRARDAAGHPELIARLDEEGHTLFVTDIPNSRFPNERLLFKLIAGDQDEPVARTAVESRWVGMPVSLLNLDVAINMLRFIINDSRLREMRRGSAREREERFRTFWNDRDPTPDTEFNELMVEYYSRIDHTWDHYTTPQQPGYESDQGRAWILYGEPNRVERRYPSNSPTREIWYYRDRTLIFEATTGFGDFRLIREE